MNRHYIFYYFFSAFLIYGCSSKDQTTGSTEKPNIVFLFADDMTYTAIQALGNREIKTPNLDRMVNKGTTFTNAYNMGAWNGAVCAASRAMLISGRFVWRADDFRKNWQQKDSTAFQQSWGKWHVDAPAEKIFQAVKHVRPGMPKDNWNHHEMVRLFAESVNQEKVDGKLVKAEDVMPIGYNRPKSENDHSWSPTDPKFGGFWEGGKHWSEVLADDAIGFINQAKSKEDPFFMYLAFNAPHDPRQAPQKYIDKYPLESISLPESWLSEYPFKVDKILEMRL